MKSTGKLRKERRGENARAFFPPLPLPYFEPSTSPLESSFRLAKSLCHFQRPNRSHGKIHLLCRLQSHQILTDVCIEKVSSCPLPPSPPRPFLPFIRTSLKFCDLAEQYLRTLLTIIFKLGKFPNFQSAKWSLS